MSVSGDGAANVIASLVDPHSGLQTSLISGRFRCSDPPMMLRTLRFSKRKPRHCEAKCRRRS